MTARVAGRRSLIDEEGQETSPASQGRWHRRRYRRSESLISEAIDFVVLAERYPFVDRTLPNNEMKAYRDTAVLSWVRVMPPLISGVTNGGFVRGNLQTQLRSSKVRDFLDTTGRPPIPRELRALIRRIARENRLYVEFSFM